MTTPRHTPGPWTAKPDYEGSGDWLIWYLYEGRPQTIGSVYEMADREQAPANAHLIAASPDLYDAGLTVQAVLEGIANTRPLDAWQEAALKDFQVAMRKAEGKETT